MRGRIKVESNKIIVTAVPPLASKSIENGLAFAELLKHFIASWIIFCITLKTLNPLTPDAAQPFLDDFWSFVHLKE